MFIGDKNVVAGQLKNSAFLGCNALSGDWLSNASKEHKAFVVRCQVVEEKLCAFKT